jgi:hypothetical protein
MPTKDRKEKRPRPPYPQSTQEPPGSDRDMFPKTDQAEDSYNYVTAEVTGANGGTPLS